MDLQQIAANTDNLFTLSSVLVAAVTALSGGIAILWRRMDAWMSECRAERRKCEEAMRVMWVQIGERRGSVRTLGE